MDSDRPDGIFLGEYGKALGGIKRDANFYVTVKFIGSNRSTINTSRRDQAEGHVT